MWKFTRILTIIAVFFLLLGVSKTDAQTTVSASTVNATLHLYLRGNHVDSISVDGTFSANSDQNLATQKAIKTYIQSALLHADSTYIIYGDNAGNPRILYGSHDSLFVAALVAGTNIGLVKSSDSSKITINYTGGVSSTPPNIGIGYRIYAPQVPGFKTLTCTGCTLDSATTNQIGITVTVPPNQGSAYRIYEPQIPGFRSLSCVSGCTLDTATTGQIGITITGGGGGGINTDVVTTIINGTSSTVPNGTNIIQFNNTAVLTYTLTLPTTWHNSNGLTIAFTSNGTITNGQPMVTLTIVNGSGQTLSQAINPNGTTFVAGESLQYHLIGTIDQRYP